MSRYKEVLEVLSQSMQMIFHSLSQFFKILHIYLVMLFKDCSVFCREELRRRGNLGFKLLLRFQSVLLGALKWPVPKASLFLKKNTFGRIVERKQGSCVPFL